MIVPMKVPMKKEVGSKSEGWKVGFGSLVETPEVRGDCGEYHYEYCNDPCDEADDENYDRPENVSGMLPAERVPSQDNE